MKVGIAFPRVRPLHSGIATDAIGRALRGIHRRPVRETLPERLHPLLAHRDRHVPNGEEA
jgi:hypothetical protein